ncbi:hypothetical protein [Thermomonospora umbrina]|uniref:Uncharacterized protein n=1 Tax=Thermomonospora umbrina TaxID=111806 RepID=A0A3D9T179_9ACTN|nr:hypothetical protein [Thermomonospora umbrina]REF00571.1 hypothetical protein DFJ69_6121 [Thermomonospora umbrina]
MQEPHLTEQALLTTHDGLSAALVLLGDYDHREAQITAAGIASLTVRTQMIVARLTTLAGELARRRRQMIRDAATGNGPAVADLVAAHTAVG